MKKQALATEVPVLDRRDELTRGAQACKRKHRLYRSLALNVSFVKKVLLTFASFTKNSLEVAVL